MQPQEGNAVEGTDYFTATEELDSGTRDNPLAVTGDVQLRDNTTYTCGWKYGTQGEDDLFDVGSVKPVQNSPDAVDHFTGKYDGLKASYSAGGLKDYSRTN